MIETARNIFVPLPIVSNRLESRQIRPTKNPPMKAAFGIYLARYPGTFCSLTPLMVILLFFSCLATSNWLFSLMSTHALLRKAELKRVMAQYTVKAKGAFRKSHIDAGGYI